MGVRIDRNTHGLPIIVQTGLDGKKKGLQSVVAGAQDFIVKGQFDSHVLEKSILFSMERFKLLREKDLLVARLQEALERVTALEGIIPICMTCHKIRNDEGAWQGLEAYISQHTTARFSHGFCEACAEKYMNEEGTS